MIVNLISTSLFLGSGGHAVQENVRGGNGGDREAPENADVGVVIARLTVIVAIVVTENARGGGARVPGIGTGTGEIGRRDVDGADPAIGTKAVTDDGGHATVKKYP